MFGSNDYKIYTREKTLKRGDLLSYSKNPAGFKIKFICDDNYSTWKEEFINELTKINLESNINILLSGGLDSLLTSQACLEADLDVYHTIFNYVDSGNIMNPKELQQALKFVLRNNRKFIIIDIDINEFFDRWKEDSKVKKFTHSILDRTLQMLMALKLDNSYYNIISESSPQWHYTLNGWCHIQTLDQFYWPEIFSKFNINGSTRIFTQNPKLSSAWINGDETHQATTMNKFNLKIGDSVRKYPYKSKLFKLFGFDLEEYAISKSTIQMYSEKKYIKHWHTKIEEGVYHKFKKDIAMEIPLSLLRDNISNSNNVWYDYKIFKTEDRNNPWYLNK